MDIQDKIDNGDYKTKLPYPDKSKIKAELDSSYSFAAGTRSQIREQEKKFLDLVDIEYQKQHKAYYADDGVLYKQFQHDAETETEILGMSQKKKDIIWNKAYDDGHSSGLYGIYNEFIDLVSFVDQLDLA